jgi:REP element-mobilizing transposase RayT
MPRPPRIQFPGAIYHVINRGNYRSDVFAETGAAHAFVETLKEAVDRYGWRLGAYVVMRNHYHFSIQTPEPNLSAGMHWLQSTFAMRFNRFRQEQGHLFQGRYQAILLENAHIWARVNDYIHLNPARAGIVAANQLGQFRWSSLGNYVKSTKFSGLTAMGWLQTMGLEDDEAGWKAYVEWLTQKFADTDPEDRSEHDALTRGWAIGDEEWKKTTLAKHLPSSVEEQVGNGGRALPKEMQDTSWALRLEAELKAANVTPEMQAEARKGASWKVEIAERLQRQYGIPVRWLAEKLQMGKPGSVRAYLWKWRRTSQITA